jgi:hypothetical protein
MCALTTYTFVNQREGNEKKRLTLTQTSDQKPTKGKEQDHLKEESFGPLRQRQLLDTTKIKTSSSKEHKPQRAPPAHMQAPP